MAETDLKVSWEKCAQLLAKTKSLGTSAKFNQWYFNLFPYPSSVLQPPWRGRGLGDSGRAPPPPH